MKYELIGDFFETELFQQVCTEYFDTVLAAMLTNNQLTETKGIFIRNGEVKKNYIDMPYTTHILNGLIPILLIYERYLQKENKIEHPESDTWLRVLMLGFTFHDANKLLRLSDDDVKGKNDLQVALKKLLNTEGVSTDELDGLSQLQLEKDIRDFSVVDFFPNWEAYKNEIGYLGLATENRTSALANDYPVRTNYVIEKLRPLCHLADGLASIQSFEDGTSGVTQIVVQKLREIQVFLNMEVPISSVQLRSSPQILLGQLVLQAANNVLYPLNKKMLFGLRDGFIFLGEPVTQVEKRAIQQKFVETVSERLDPVRLTKITYQQCEFGFVNTIPLSISILEKVESDRYNEFLALAPKKMEKIDKYDDFVSLIRRFLTACPYAATLIEPKDEPVTKGSNMRGLTLHIDTVESDSENALFRRVLVLQKIRWLSKNAEWKKEFQEVEKQNIKLPKPIEWQDTKLETFQDFLIAFENTGGNSDSNKKSLLAILRASQLVSFEPDIEGLISKWQNEILTFCNTKSKVTNDEDSSDEDSYENNSDEYEDNEEFIEFNEEITATGELEVFFKQNFHTTEDDTQWLLNEYNPIIPPKSEMCAFTGVQTKREYKQVIAFGMNARGANNRSVTTLNNKVSHISELMIKENLLRRTEYPKAQKADLMLYHDFFELSLMISPNILDKNIKVRDLKRVDNVVRLNPVNAFRLNLYNVHFVEIPIKKKVERTYQLIQSSLELTQTLQMRTYVTDILSPYRPHKGVFFYENAPIWVKQLGWNDVRLAEHGFDSANLFTSIHETLAEMQLLDAFGKKLLSTNIKRVAENRQSYFRIWYKASQTLKDKEKNLVYNLLKNFIKEYPLKIKGMTVIEKLVELALPIEVIRYDSSGSQQTWLIRTSIDLIRQYAKETDDANDIIQKICGRIDHGTRFKEYPPSTDEIKAFVEGVYYLLFVQEWKKQMPIRNSQKDWIYQFGFVYQVRSDKYFKDKKANKLASPQ